MQIGKGQVPFRLNLEPLNSVARPRVLAGAFDAARTQERNQQITGVAREVIQQKDRSSTYRDVASQLGNIREALSAPQGPGSLQRIAESLNEAITYLDQATAKGAARQDDALLRDIRDGLEGLFAKSGDESLRGLADAGISRENGELTIDAERLAALEAEQPEALETFIGTLIGERTSPLVSAATQALSDTENRGAFEQSLAQKAVAVQADISRLETRKQGLVQQQSQFDRIKANLQQQAEALRKTQRQLEQDEARELPPDLLDLESRRAALTAGTAPAATAAPLPAAPSAPATPGLPATPVAPGLSSFGLT